MAPKLAHTQYFYLFIPLGPEFVKLLKRIRLGSVRNSSFRANLTPARPAASHTLRLSTPGSRMERAWVFSSSRQGQPRPQRKRVK